MVYTSHKDEMSEGHKNDLREAERAVQDGGFTSAGNAQSIRAQENAAAAGHASSNELNRGNSTNSRLSQGGGGGASGSGTATGADARDDLKNKENASLYKPGNSTGGGESSGSGGGGIAGRFKNMFKGGTSMKTTKRRMATAGILSVLVGGGGGLGLFGAVSGPWQFLQFGQLMQQFQLDSHSDQQAGRLAKAVRNIHYTLTGQYERTRMGMLGNHIANKVENKLRAQGFDVQYDNGNFGGYRVNPRLLSSADYPDLADRSPQGVAEYFEQKFGVPAAANGDFVDIPATGSYHQDKRLMKNVFKATGWKSVHKGLGSQLMKKRGNLSYKWIKVLQGDTIDDRWRAYWTDKVDKVRGNKATPRVTPDQRLNEEGERVDNGDEANALEDLQNEAADAQEGITEGDPAAMNTLKERIRAQLTPGNGAGFGLGLIGTFCAILAFMDRIDEINRTNLDEPMKQLASMHLSIPEQIKDNTDVNDEYLGFASTSLYNEEEQTSWYDGRVVQGETGRPQNGKDLPADAKLSPTDNIITRIGSVPGVAETCELLNGALGVIIAIAIGIAAPARTLIEAAIGLVVGALVIEPVVDMLANLFAANSVPVDAAGADLGNFAFAGGFLMGNDDSLSHGGVPVTPAQANLIAAATQEDNEAEFREQNLAYKLFNPADSRTLAGQLIENQVPDPAANVKHTALGLLNVGKSFGSLFTKMIPSANAQATTTGYDFGIPEIYTPPEEMNAEEFENPYTNANVVADLLDAQEEAGVPMTLAPALPGGEPMLNPDNYIARIKICIGADVVKEATELPDGRQVDQWVIKPPVTGDIPYNKDIMLETNKCLEGTAYLTKAQQGTINDWTRVRMWVMDSQVMNALACYEGEDGDEISDKACEDIGLTGGAGGGAGILVGSGPTCTNGKAASAAAAVGYTLKGCEDWSIAGDFGQYNPYTGGGASTVNGTFRTPDACTVVNDLLVLSQQANKGTCGGSMNDDTFANKTGYWQVRMAVTGPKSDAHPVLITWPVTDDWPAGAEYDFVEVNSGDECLGAFLHYPNHQPIRQEFAEKCPFDLTQFHEYGFEWLPDTLIGYVDGEEWFRFDGQVAHAPDPMRLTIQLDNLGSGPPPEGDPALMQVDWAHLYVK